MEILTFHIDASSTGKRLDSFLVEQELEVSREKIKCAIQNGQCRIDSFIIKSPSTRLKAGQCIELNFSNDAEQLKAELGTIEIIWQDENLVICNKPAGITMHPCPSCPEGTYIQQVAANFPCILQQEGLRPGIVHRLDKDTSGLVAIALDEPCRLRLSASFANREISKSYLALVHGVPPKQGEIQEPIGRDPKTKVKMAVVAEKHGGRQAHSAYETLYADPAGRFSLVKVKIFTGRTHQIRVHMAHIGHVLMGDTTYGAQDNPLAKRQMLHAWKLAFTHPITQENLSFCKSPPQDMQDCALNLSKELQKIIIVGLPGCGKSTLLEKFNVRGIATWSADAVVEKLYKPGAAGHDYFLKRFGNEFIAHPKAEVDRQALRKAMYDPSIRQEVNTQIHALVYADIQNFWEYCLKNGASFGVAEVPLYLENGRHQVEDTHIVGLKCSQDLRYDRLKNERSWTDEQCHNVDGWQWSEDKKMAACHTVINNSKDTNELDIAIDELLKKLDAKQKSRLNELEKKLDKLWNTQD